MLHPKLLINLTIAVSLALTAAFAAIIWAPPYTGFMLTPHPETGALTVSKADDWIVDQGLTVGDQVTSIASGDGGYLELEPKHVLTSTFQAREYYENREARLKELGKVHRILKHQRVEVGLANGSVVSLVLDQPRSLGSVNYGVWIRFVLSLSAPLMAALVWIWRPQQRETVLLLMSGLGLFLLTLPSAATIYEIDMYYPGAFLFWLLKLSGGVGDFIYLGFATSLLLYFPQKLPNADLWNQRLLTGLFVYALVTLLNDWRWGAPVSEQFLYYSYNETYAPMVVFYAILLRLCFLQWRISAQQPVERAQAWWVILSWTLGPSIFVVFYLLPVSLGEESFISRTMNTVVIAVGFWMILIGIARYNLLQIEQYIGTAYQWSIVSLLFFGLDILLVYAINLSPQVTTYIVLALVLWGYLPLRQWFHQRVELKGRQKYQDLYNHAVVQLVENSMNSTVRTDQSWDAVLATVFSPLSVSDATGAATSTVKKRGQQLSVRTSRFAAARDLEYAEGGSRLFTSNDVELVDTLAMLFEQLNEFRDAYFSGQTQERDRIRRDLHDQVGHKLLSIIYSEKDETTRRLAQETMAVLRELTQALKDEPVRIIDSIIRLRSLSNEACEHSDLLLTWNEAIEDNDREISSHQNLNILNIIRELLNNTIRHAGATAVAITVRDVPSALVIVMSDDGCGFDQESITPGSGLHNIQSRVDELRAKIDWDTSSGTQVTLTVPFVRSEALI